jgi:hypothetical protein
MKNAFLVFSSLLLVLIASNETANKKFMIKLEKEHRVYKGNLALGSNKQELGFIFSTGSSISWVGGPECEGDCVERQKFKPNTSDSFKSNTTISKDYNV